MPSKTPPDTSSTGHIPVLPRELIDKTITDTGNLFVDCTFGGGSHTRLILEKTPQNSVVVALDHDVNALSAGHALFEEEIKSGRLILLHTNFAHIHLVLASYLEKYTLAAVIADLGVSSMQIDQPERGFSFRFDGPLDMRMDQTLKVNAADVVNTYSVQELTRIFTEYGEEPKAFSSANKIVAQREVSLFTRTNELAKLVEKAWYNPRQKSRKHPATRVFQALRMFVNDELKSIDTLIDRAFGLLSPGGRLGIISFHSLEDRRVKHAFLRLAGKQTQTSSHGQKVPYVAAPDTSKANIITRSPEQPSSEEIDSNPRARSAKLRVIEKL